jgi:hypothetical protein
MPTLFPDLLPVTPSGQTALFADDFAGGKDRPELIVTVYGGGFATSFRVPAGTDVERAARQQFPDAAKYDDFTVSARVAE